MHNARVARFILKSRNDMVLDMIFGAVFIVGFVGNYHLLIEVKDLDQIVFYMIGISTFMFLVSMAQNLYAYLRASIVNMTGI